MIDESDVGKGASFLFTLPLAVEAADSEPHCQISRSGVGQREILVIDDDEHLRLALGDILKSAGYRVQVACNGHEGLEHLEDSHPNLIVLDMQMPVMSG